MNKFSVLIVLLINYIILIGFLTNAQSSDCTTPAQRPGNCVLIKQCPRIVDILSFAKRPLPANVVTYLQRSQCGFEQSQPKICCEIEEQEPTATIATVNTVIGATNNNNYDRPQDVTNHRNINLLPFDVCGVDSQNKISNGNKTALFQYPWMALLQYEDGSGLRFGCGGSLINNRYILTAGHCVTKLRTSTLVNVRLGEYNLETDTDCQTILKENVCSDPVQDIAVESVSFLPTYNTPKFSDDIGLIRLSQTVQFSDSIKPICLPTSQSAQSTTLNKLIVAGWGGTETGARLSDILLQAIVSYVPNANCQPKYNQLLLKAAQMCAGGATNIDTCRGDSGGPLMYPAVIGDYGPRMVQFGIVSAGLGTCGKNENTPGLYTRVAHYLQWILDELKP